MQECYCGRTINLNGRNPSFFDEEYCSDYCRRFKEQGLKILNGEDVHGKSQLRGFTWRPKIEVKCEMCEETFELRYELESANRQFCSRDCHNKLKTTRKRKSEINYNLLRLLRHRRKYHNNGWVTAEVIDSYMTNRKDVKGSVQQWGRLLRKWISRGVVETKIDSKVMEYRLNKKYTVGPLAKHYHEHDKSQVRTYL